ncbi:MAG: alpha/beta fold hydrolase [Pyrinomonadaceae bacterium]
MHKSSSIKLLASFFLLFLSSQFLYANTYSKDLTLEPYVFENSKNEKVNAELGRLKVPENRNSKNSKQIELVFVRFKSTSKNPGPPIIYLAGGPGGSGIASAKYDRFELFMAMREFGDVIALDQRGTGLSTPNLQCPGSLAISLDSPLTRERIIGEEAEKIKLCSANFEDMGVDVEAYNTVESAKDLNDLRIALGAEKISLWGISYGTHLALATIRQFGEFVDRAILAGIEGPDDTNKLPGDLQKLLLDLDKRAKADPLVRSDIPDLLKLMKSVLDRLERQPVKVTVSDRKENKPVEVTIGKYDVQFIAGNYAGSDMFLSFLPRLFKSMDEGDYSFVAEQSLIFRRGNVPSLMAVAMDCASGGSPQRMMQINKEKQAALLSDAINVPFPEICDSINYAKLGEAFRTPVTSSVPVLFISGTLDGRTPVSNAEAVIKGFKNNTHLIIEGAGHSDPLFLSSPMIKETMLKFMSGADLPRILTTKTAAEFKIQPVSRNSKQNTENTTAKKIDDYITPFVRAGHFSGVVLAAENGKVIYEKAFGLANADFDIPNQLNTRIGIASITKSMTSVILTRLIEEKKIAADDKIDKYITDFPSGDRITIEMLARHRSGISHRVMPPEFETVPYTSAEFVEKVKQSKLEFEPDSKRLYSSAGYSVLARCLEIASGKTYSELLEEYVFRPAGMKDSLHFGGETIMKHRAQDYLRDGDGIYNASIKDYSFLVGAGSVFGTAGDVYKFGEAILDGKYGEAVRTGLVGKTVFSSSGSTNGHRAYIEIEKDNKYGYVILSNLSTGAFDVISQGITDILQGKEIPPPTVPEPQIIPNPNRNTDEFLGRYRRENGSEFEFVIKDKGFYAGDIKLLPIREDCFFDFKFYGEVCFVRDDNGKIKHISWASPGFTSVWVRQ